MGELLRTVRVAVRPNAVRAVVEDDFHHFRVTVRHDGTVVTDVHGDTLRRPWSTCQEAAGQLQRLRGMTLSRCASDVARHTDRQFQCTHLFDLAGLAVASATRNLRTLRYDMRVTDAVDGAREAELSKDGQRMIQWSLQQTRIIGSAHYDGIELREGFADWALRTLSEDECEAALALRRAVFISNGRRVDLDTLTHPPSTAGCFTLQPHRAPQAIRMLGSTQDFTHRAYLLTQTDEAWLAFD
jgi:hypothetical protein